MEREYQALSERQIRDNKVRAHFRQKTLEQLQKEKAHYEYIIAKPGMDWMKPAWSTGLQIVNEIINEKHQMYENSCQDTVR